LIERIGDVRVSARTGRPAQGEAIMIGDMQIFDPSALIDELAAQGYATRALLPADSCRALAALYDDDARFRKRIVMKQHAYGRGEYKYFTYPLPDPVAELRGALYSPLAAVG